MKKTTIILLAALAVAFTGCKKESNQQTDPAPVAAQKGPVKTATINYLMRFRLPENVTSGLQLTHGHFSLGDFFFDGNYSSSKSGLNYVNVNSTVDMGFKLAEANSLGTLSIPCGNYGKIYLGASFRTTSLNALYIEGIYFAPGNKYPIQITINEPFTIRTEVATPYNIKASSYQAILIADLEPLTTAINNDMIANAKISGDFIIVNATENVEIYNLIRERLATLPVSQNFALLP